VVCSSSTRHRIPQRRHIVLAGGCAAITGVDELVEERLGIPTSIANPFANMALASRVNARTSATTRPR